MLDQIRTARTATKVKLMVVLLLFTTAVSSLALTFFNKESVKIETIKLGTMVCDQCVDRLTKVINSVEGVQNVDISLEKKQAVVTFDESVTSLDKIENAITASGYDANTKKADKTAFDKLPSCCKMKNNNEHKDMNMEHKMDNGCCNKNGNMNNGGCTRNH